MKQVKIQKDYIMIYKKHLNQINNNKISIIRIDNKKNSQIKVLLLLILLVIKYRVLRVSNRRL